MTISDLIAWAALAIAIYNAIKEHFNSRTKVTLYAHRATDTTGGSLFLAAHATATGPGASGIWPDPRDHLYLVVSCNKETDLTQARFDFGLGGAESVQSAQGELPARLLPNETWIGWIPWDQVAAGITEQAAESMGRAVLNVTGTKEHRSKPTPPNLRVGGRVPARANADSPEVESKARKELRAILDAVAPLTKQIDHRAHWYAHNRTGGQETTRPEALITDCSEFCAARQYPQPMRLAAEGVRQALQDYAECADELNRFVSDPAPTQVMNDGNVCHLVLKRSMEKKAALTADEIANAVPLERSVIQWLMDLYERRRALHSTASGKLRAAWREARKASGLE